MKTKFNILSASLVGIVCASIMTPSFAASSVRSLGGTGTYAGTSSVRSNTAAATSGSAVTAARAGSIRINNGTTAAKTNTGASLRTPSTRSATAPRLSIGKYLAGSSALGGGSSTGGNVNVGQSGVTSSDIKDLQDGLAALEKEISNMTGGAADVEFEYDPSTGTLTFVHGDESFSADLATQESITELENQLNEVLKSSFATLEGSDYITVATDEDENTKTVSAILSALDSSGALTDGLTTAAAVTDYVTGYAIPKPSTNCFEDTVCVLSVGKDKQYYWLELIDEVVTETVATSEIETYESEPSDETEYDL